MPRPVTTRSAKSVQSWASKTHGPARSFAPFATQASLSVPAGRGSRVAVAAHLYEVLDVQTFAQPPQAAANQELDEALLLPFV